MIGFAPDKKQVTRFKSDGYANLIDISEVGHRLDPHAWVASAQVCHWLEKFEQMKHDITPLVQDYAHPFLATIFAQCNHPAFAPWVAAQIKSVKDTGGVDERLRFWGSDVELPTLGKAKIIESAWPMPEHSLIEFSDGRVVWMKHSVCLVTG